MENGRFLNDPVEQAAQCGLKGSGDMTYYHTTPAFIQTTWDYKNGGSAPNISLQFYADSAGSQYERIGVTLSDIILANIGLIVLDDSSDNAQTIEITSTLNNFDLV